MTNPSESKDRRPSIASNVVPKLSAEGKEILKKEILDKDTEIGKVSARIIVLENQLADEQMLYNRAKQSVIVAATEQPILVEKWKSEWKEEQERVDTIINRILKELDDLESDLKLSIENMKAFPRPILPADKPAIQELAQHIFQLESQIESEKVEEVKYRALGGHCSRLEREGQKEEKERSADLEIDRIRYWSKVMTLSRKAQQIPARDLKNELDTLEWLERSWLWIRVQLTRDEADDPKDKARYFDMNVATNGKSQRHNDFISRLSVEGDEIYILCPRYTTSVLSRHSIWRDRADEGDCKVAREQIHACPGLRVEIKPGKTGHIIIYGVAISYGLDEDGEQVVEIENLFNRSVSMKAKNIVEIQ